MKSVLRICFLLCVRTEKYNFGKSFKWRIPQGALVNHKSGGFGPYRGCIVLLMRLASAVEREVHYPLRSQRPAAAARYLRNVLKIVAIRTPDPIENYWFPIVIWIELLLYRYPSGMRMKELHLSTIGSRF